MHRIAIELPLLGVAAALMASMILAGGTAIEPPAQPVVLPGRLVESPTTDLGTCLESPATVPLAPDIIGQGALCPDDGAVRATLRVSGVIPGEIYTAWLSVMHRPIACPDALCAPLDLAGTGTDGHRQRIGGGAASPTGTLDRHGELHGQRLVHGDLVTRTLLRQCGRAGPHALTVFAVP